MTRCILAAGTAALLSVIPLVGCSGKRAGGPRAVFATAKKDIGVVKAGETAKLAFPIRNEGGRPLEILGVDGECGCMSPEFPKSIAPSGSGEIKVTFEPQMLWSGKMEKGVKVRTNDPAQAETRLVMAVEVVPVVAMDPRSPLVIQYKPGETYRREIKLTPREDRAMTMSKPETDSPFVKAELAPPASGDRTHSRLLRLVVGPYNGPGDFNTSVRLATTDAKVPQVSVAVVGLAQSGVVVSPQSVLVPMLSQDRAGKEISRLQVFSRSNDLKLLGVETGSPALKAEITPTTEGRFYDVVLKYAGGAKTGPLDTKLLVKTDDKRFPTVSVPFTTVVQ